MSITKVTCPLPSPFQFYTSKKKVQFAKTELKKRNINLLIEWRKAYQYEYVHLPHQRGNIHGWRHKNIHDSINRKYDVSIWKFQFWRFVLFYIKISVSYNTILFNCCIFLYRRIPKLLEILKVIDVQEEELLVSLIAFFHYMCCGFGRVFTKEKVISILELYPHDWYIC